MLKRRIFAGLLAAAIGATGLVGSGGPVGAAVPTGFNHVVSGNFFGGPRDEMLFHSNGPDPEMLVSVAVAGGPNQITFTPYELPDSGLARPIVGDFDGDGFDEIFWYTRGPEPDVLWDFTAYDAVITTNFTVTGTFTPVAGDFTGDGTDDIFFYGPGTALDLVWEFDAGGTYTESQVPVSGTYVPLVGSIGTNETDDIFWYAAGPAADSMWDFNVGSLSRVSRAMPVAGTYIPFTFDLFGEGWGGGDIFWYAPGAATDTVWDFYLLGSERFSYQDPVKGTYTPMSGDYLGDGLDDIVWLHKDGFHLWMHRPSGDAIVRLAYYITFASPAPADAGVATSPPLLPAIVSGTRTGSLESSSD